MPQSIETAREINQALISFSDYVSQKISDDDKFIPGDPSTFSTVDTDSPAYPSFVNEDGETIVTHVKSTVSFTQALIKNKLMQTGELVPLNQPDQVA